MSFSRFISRSQHLYWRGGMQVSTFRRVMGFFDNWKKKRGTPFEVPRFKRICSVYFWMSKRLDFRCDLLYTRMALNSIFKPLIIRIINMRIYACRKESYLAYCYKGHLHSSRSLRSTIQTHESELFLMLRILESDSRSSLVMCKKHSMLSIEHGYTLILQYSEGCKNI